MKCVQQNGRLFIYLDIINDDNCFEELFDDTTFDASLTHLFNINTQQMINGLRECMTGQGMFATL